MESFKYFGYLGNTELIFCLGVSGGSNVGISHLLCTYVYGNSYDFHHSQKAKSYHKKVSVDHHMPVNLEIWNPSALKKPRNMNLTYQRVHVFIVMYDITQRRSFAEAKKLVDAFTRKARPGAFVVLVGNKTDLESRREVSLKEAQNYADGKNIVEIFMEVSALTGKNVKDLFSEIVKRFTEPAAVISETLALEEKTLDLSRRNLDRDQWIYCIEEFLRRRENFSLPNILSLNLSHNNFEELFPSIMKLFQNLTCLYVNDNRLSFLPESMRRLERLQELDLRNNQLKGLDVVRELPELKKLLVEGNPLTLEEIRSLIKHVDATAKTIFVDILDNVT